MTSVAAVSAAVIAEQLAANPILTLAATAVSIVGLGVRDRAMGRS